MPIDPQEFGQLQAEVGALRREVDRLRATLDEINTSVHSIHEKISEARGGWKMLVAVGGLVGTVGAGLGWLASHMGLRL